MWHVLEAIGYGVFAAACALGIVTMVVVILLYWDVFNGKNPFQ